MSAIPSQSNNLITQVDHGVGSALETGFSFLLDPIGRAFKRGMEGISDFEEHKDFHNETPTILQIASNVIIFFASYHKRVLKNSSQWAKQAEFGAVKITKWCLYPLTFSRIGVAIQKIISEKIIGNIALAITFCTFQFFHLVPYITGSAIISGGLFLYKTAPVLLITFLAGSILMIQVYFINRLIGEVGVANKILEDTNKILDQRLNEVSEKLEPATLLWNLITLPITLPLSGVIYITLRIKRLAYGLPIKPEHVKK